MAIDSAEGVSNNVFPGECPGVRVNSTVQRNCKPVSLNLAELQRLNLSSVRFDPQQT